MLVNHFETLVAQGGISLAAGFTTSFCGKGVAVENDGGIYACDHYVYPEYRLGTAAGKAWLKWFSLTGN